MELFLYCGTANNWLFLVITEITRIEQSNVWSFWMEVADED